MKPVEPDDHGVCLSHLGRKRSDPEFNLLVHIHVDIGHRIGTAIIVEDARPDVENAYPSKPLNYRAGWGYSLLTNLLPNQGNGEFTLYAFAVDKENNKSPLGQKTITGDNAGSVLPFGTIDTPGQGAAISGNLYYNFGWALTPQPHAIPFDGSTIIWVSRLLRARSARDFRRWWPKRLWERWGSFWRSRSRVFPGAAAIGIICWISVR